MKETIGFNLNGKPVSLSVEGDKGLLWVLRTDFDLTGTKFGCGINYCGACTVVVDGEPVRSCQYPVKSVSGKNVTTIEGLANNGKLHPLQDAFIEHNAMQCGFCTSGMIMQGYSLLEKNPKPTKEEILEAMENNLCRCGAHVRIIKAMETASQ